MKKRIFPYTVLFLLTVTASLYAGEEVRADRVLRVVVDALRIRDEPTTEDSEILGMLHLDDYVVVLEYADEHWVKIEAPDGTVGWSCVTLEGEVYLESLQVDYGTEIYFTLHNWEGEPVSDIRLELIGTPVFCMTDVDGDVWLYPVPIGTWDLRCIVGDASAVVSSAVDPERKDEATYTVDLGGPHALTVHHTYAESGVAKPNIYIYPIEETEVTVRLVFPSGGEITVSDPPYDDGWTVDVTPEGTIDGDHTFLFYEGWSPGRVQHSEGWVVPREELEEFFRENLAATHFFEHEIEDFVEFWVPRLVDHPYFAIYPQYNPIYDEMVGLEVEPEPWTVIRLAYVVRGLEEEFELMPAAIPAYEIGGFTIHEWGVVLSPPDMDAYLY
jgi:hypothetical protein